MKHPTAKPTNFDEANDSESAKENEMTFQGMQQLLGFTRVKAQSSLWKYSNITVTYDIADGSAVFNCESMATAYNYVARLVGTGMYNNVSMSYSMEYIGDSE